MTSDPVQFKPVLLVDTVDEDHAFRAFLSDSGQGVCFVAETYEDDGRPSLPSDAGDFAKWLRQQHPALQLEVPSDTPKLVRRSADIWLPLVYLAGDTSAQLFLNMAASYLYDRAKGALKGETRRVHMKVMYQDKINGKTKRFEFSGDADALARAVKKFDLNNFFDESA